MDGYQQKQYSKSVDEGRVIARQAMGRMKDYHEMDISGGISVHVRVHKDAGRTLSVISELITMSMDKYGRDSETTKWLIVAIKEYIEKELRGEFRT